jgi:hypothetical protein
MRSLARKGVRGTLLRWLPDLGSYEAPPNPSLQRTRRQSLRSFLLAAELDIVRWLRVTANVPTPRPLPRSDNTLVLRTDFSDEAAWRSLCRAIQEPVGEFRAYVECVSDPQYEGVTPEQLVTLNSQGYNFMFLADHVALAGSDQLILVVDLSEVPGRTFRVVPYEAWGVENNLSLSNMGFSEFAEAVGPDGVFRGFPQG